MEWTAEILLIHPFQRPDILSYKDLGIRRGIMKLYGYEVTIITGLDFEIIQWGVARLYSLATLYIVKYQL